MTTQNDRLCSSEKNVSIDSSDLIEKRFYVQEHVLPQIVTVVDYSCSPPIENDIAHFLLDTEASFAETPEGFGFSDASIRQGFIRKVYLILTVQLLFTASIISIFVFYKPAAALAGNTGFMIFVAIFAILLLIVITCCGEIRRKSPINYILLGMFTLAESLLVGLISSNYLGDTVLMAMGMTVVICFGLTLFAFQTRFDFTFCGCFVFISLLFLVVIGITAPLLSKYGQKDQTMNLVYASIGAIVFFIYFIADTQIMMAGGHKYSLSPEEYIFAALNLYIDIIYIFVYLLRIFR